MKLRVRSSCNGGRVWRVEVPNDASWTQLQTSIFETCFPEGCPSGETASNIVLSMNKKDPILAAPDASICTGLHIRGGDLLWLISPEPRDPITSGGAAPLPVDMPMETPADPPTISVGAQPPPSKASQNSLIIPWNGKDTNGLSSPWPMRVPAVMVKVLCANANFATSAQGILLLAAHAVMLETGFCTNGANPDEPYKVPVPTTPPTALRIEYRVAAASEDPKSTCLLSYSPMGQAVLLAESTADRRARYIQLQANDYVTPHATPLESSTSSLCEHVGMAMNGGLVVSKRYLLALNNLTDLWNCLKNRISLPGLAAASESAGLPPPIGLLTLPSELKQRVLGLLGALDLVALGSTCSETRHMAAADALWKPLYYADFPSISPHALGYVDPTTGSPIRGWKWAYGVCHADRREREEGARRQRRFRPAVPYFGARPPFYPPAAPRGFPGIIGGESDRLPFLGGSGMHYGYGGTRRLGQGGGPPRWI